VVVAQIKDEGNKVNDKYKVKDKVKEVVYRDNTLLDLLLNIKKNYD
jgi:hypothetical protein